MPEFDREEIDQKISKIEEELGELTAEAATLSEITKDYANFFSDQSAALLRWVMAACLSVNGGAIVAAFSIEASSTSSIKIAVFLFLLGICSAIIAGTAFANVSLLLSNDYSEASLDLGRLSREGAAKIEKILPTRLSKLHRRLDLLSLVPYLSLLCFLAGIMTLVSGIK